MTYQEQQMIYAKKLFSAHIRQSDFTKNNFVDCLLLSAKAAKVSVFELAKELDINYKDDQE